MFSQFEFYTNFLAFLYLTRIITFYHIHSEASSDNFRFRQSAERQPARHNQSVGEIWFVLLRLRMCAAVIGRERH